MAIPYHTILEAETILSQIAGETITVFDPRNGPLGYWVAACKRPGDLKNRQQYIEQDRSVAALIARINQAGIYVDLDTVHQRSEDEHWAIIRFYIPLPDTARSPFAR